MRLPPVIGHRGAMGHAPENTVASFIKACELGARWVEFDVMLSRDGEVVVIHDQDVERTTNGTGKVASMDLAEIQSLDAGGWFAEKFAGERIPTLAQALSVLAKLGLGANVEIKPSKGCEDRTGRVVAALLSKFRAANSLPALISSFSLESLAAARKAAPDIGRALILGRVRGSWRKKMSELECSALHTGAKSLTPELAHKVLDAGYALRCFTVNSGSEAAKLYAMGVEAVFSDYPERIKPPHGKDTTP